MALDPSPDTPGPAPDARRSIPSVERVAQSLRGLPPPLLVEAARSAVDGAREALRAGQAVAHDEVIAKAQARVDDLTRRQLRRVINATGVIVHTNLGRVPMGLDTLAAATEIGSGYSNLEYRLDAGVRGSRHEHAGTLLARACGAEAGIVVNNNAAAVLLVLAALARGRRVVVSRGELVEIGGGFRVPEVMAESGAVLVEVGTTNRTRAADYAAAVAAPDDTALLLKVHASNYRIVGFTESTSVAELATIGPPVVVDAGSGLLDEQTPWLASGRPAWLGDEPGIRQCIDAGAAIVTFSGDKLLGGPQAGIVVGRQSLVDQVARHPLARAMRADKLTLAALQHLALVYLRGDAESIPLWRMATATVSTLLERARAIVPVVPTSEVTLSDAVAGGGSLPGLTIPSAGIRVATGAVRPDRLLAALRDHAVVARADGEAVIVDLRTVDPIEDEELARRLAAATRATGLDG